MLARLAFSLSLTVLLQAQELQLTNARVWTGTGSAWEGPLVIRDGLLQPMGTQPGAGARTVDLEGCLVVPGLHDAHAHLRGLGDALENVDLTGTKSFDEVVERVVAAAARTPKGEWIVGRGWDQNDWAVKEMPHHAELSAETPDHPVWLVRVDGHAGLANLIALRASGIVASTGVPSGGEIQLDEDGDPSGVLVDAAMDLVVRPEPTTEQLRRRLLAAQQRCLQAGLTCVHDAGVTDAELTELRLLHAAGKWQLRTYVMLAASEQQLIRKGPWASRDGLLVVRAVKAYADGALGSRGAALLEPYADRPGWKGLVLPTPPNGLAALSQICADSGMQLCTHAIGDAANRAVLDAYAATKFPKGVKEARFRIEHAQIVADADFARFAELGVIPAMQPTHLTSDMPWAPQRLGSRRIENAYAWKRFHALGVPVPFGSDFPVEGVDPCLGLFAAVTTATGPGKSALRPDQQLDLATALRGFTRDAAFASFAEDRLGTIEPGKVADLTVFDRDLLALPPEAILEARVRMTIVAGKVCHESVP